MKKIWMSLLVTALALCGTMAAAESEKETLNFKEDSHEVIVTAEAISRNDEYGETMFDIRVSMDGEQTQAFNFTAESVNEGEQEVYLCDVNMDGYPDLALLNSMGASDGFASYYVYDPAAGQFVFHPELDDLSFYRAQFYPEKRYVLNYLHEGAATGTWMLYQWQLDGEFKLLSEAGIQFASETGLDNQLTAWAGRVENGEVEISYTSEPFAYEDDTTWYAEQDKLMELLFDGDDPGEAAEMGLMQ